MILQFVYDFLATHFAQLNQQNKRSHLKSYQSKHLCLTWGCIYLSLFIVSYKPNPKITQTEPPKTAPRLILFTVRSTHSDRSLFHTSQLVK